MPRFFYDLQNLKAYLVFLNIVFIVHICLAFFEPRNLSDLNEYGLPAGVIGVEIMCIIIEFCDLSMQFYVMWTFKIQYPLLVKLGLSENSDKESKKNRFAPIILQLIVCVAIVIDFIITNTARKSIKYFFPLRPFLLLFRNTPVREEAKNFAKTLSIARDVFLLYILVVVVFASMGVLLFRRLLFTNGPQSSYVNFIRSVTSTFTFVNQADNFNEVVTPTYFVSAAYLIYWVVLSVFGMFFVLGLVIGQFQNGFKRLRDERRKRSLKKKRVGFLAAFALLDSDGSDQLDEEEFILFMKTLRNDIKSENIDNVFKQIMDAESEYTKTSTAQTHASSPIAQANYLSMNSSAPAASVNNDQMHHNRSHSRSSGVGGNFGTRGTSQSKSAAADANPSGPAKSLSLEVFVRSVERFFGVNLGEDDLNKLNMTRVEKVQTTLQFVVFERTWYRKLFQLVVLSNLFVVALYGLYDDEILLDAVMGIFVILYAVEIVLKLFAYGPKKFWYYSDFYHEDGSELQMMANRFDLLVTAVSFLAFVISRGIIMRFYFQPDEDQLRFVMTFPLLRFLSSIHRTRSLMFTLLNLIPKFLSIFVLLLIAYFIYAIIGVQLLSDKFSTVLQDRAPENNFDTLGNAMVSLYVMTLAQNWSDLMYAAVRVTGSFAVTWYFVSFLVLVSLVFTNVFIGVVLDAFQSVNQHGEGVDEKARENEKKAAGRTLLNKIKGISGSSGVNGSSSKADSLASPSNGVNRSTSASSHISLNG